jgi:plasmid stabilization system protein ParE
MYQVYITEPAEQDLEEIAEYIAIDNPYRALSFIEEIQSTALKVLSEFPKSGKRYKKSYCFPFHHYLIFYDVNDKQRTVAIHTIKHSGQYKAYRPLMK